MTTRAAPRRPSVFSRLYTGTGAFDIVGRRKIWYILFGSLMLICIASIVFRGFVLGIDFEGGTRILFPATGGATTATTDQVKQVVAGAIGQEPESVQEVGTGSAKSILVRTEALDNGKTFAATKAIFDTFQPVGADGVPSRNVISVSAVSASWGSEIT